MKLTTPKPPEDVLKILPKLAGRSATTVRLHPRPGRVSAVSGLKIGGNFLWPADEPWPVCHDSAHEQPNPLAAILQLRAHDFPEMKFLPRNDVFQLLWCPTGHGDWREPKPFVFWWNSTQVGKPLRSCPSPIVFKEGLVPKPCCLNPEKVMEYPHIGTLPRGFQDKLQERGLDELYQFELSTCPGNKVGGHVNWVQDPADQVCNCGRKMAYLLTLTDSELANGWRWLPNQDQWVRGSKAYKRKQTVCNAPGFNFGHGCYYFFICRACRDWPIKMYFQR
jgi:hypothetical protein